MMIRTFFAMLLCFGPVGASAGEIMFEGYYRINLENKPIGYLIQRYEFDPKTKQFASLSFQRAKFGGKVVQESLKAYANDKFQPVSYQFTAQVGEDIKIIDGTFKGEVMKLMITDGKKIARHEDYKIPKGTFLSSFLLYIMMQKKLAINEAFKYSAVAEEDGSSYYGKSWFESKEDKGEYSIFRILNTFKAEKYISNLAVIPDPKNPDHYIKGEVFATNSPVKNISTELVANAGEATEGQLVPNKILITLFGNMPTGKVNLVSQPPLKASPLKPATNKIPNPAPGTLPKMVPSSVPPNPLPEPPPEPGK